MPKLLNWCDEPSMVHWNQVTSKLPDWNEAPAGWLTKAAIQGAIPLQGSPSSTNHEAPDFSGLASQLTSTAMDTLFTFRQCPRPVRRLGLATRGNTHLAPDDVWLALHAGINYWNWCGHEDAMAAAARELGSIRSEVVIAIQLESRDNVAAEKELEDNLRHLRTDYIDVVTFYYVEHQEEWGHITGDRGALTAMRAAQQQGLVRLIGLTTHQRPLAVEAIKSRKLDLLMARYNAAHRGAETSIFPMAQDLHTPVVTFTSLRWKGLLQPTPEDLPNFKPPSASQWYRFVLSNPAVAVALMAPDSRKELQENLSLLSDWRPPTQQEREMLNQHGERVRKHAGRFP